MNTIAVLGATGRTGGATLRELHARGATVRALLRKTEGPAATRLRSEGVELTRADMDDVASLVPALTGCERLFHVQPAFDARGRHDAAREWQQGRNVAEAAGRAGVRHVVQISAGPGQPVGVAHFDVKLEIRAAFEAAGLVVTALHPAPFMELMRDPTFAPALSTWGVEPRILGWDTPIPWVAVDDVGRAAAQCLLDPVPTQSSLRALVADHRSLAECRALLRERGLSVRRFPVPTWLFRQMIGSGLIAMWKWMKEAPPLPRSDDGFQTVPEWVKGLR